MVIILEDPSGSKLKTDVTISEKVKANREDLVRKMVKGAHEECQDKIRDEGTLVGAGCVCKKLVNKEWQRKFI